MSQIEKQQNSQTNIYSLEKNHSYRYVNLIIIIISALCNSFVVQVFSTINNQITNYLPGTTTTQISLSALIFMLIHPIVIIPCNYLLDTYSVKLGISINCILAIIGVCIRMLIEKSFIWVIIGNGIIGLGNVFLIIIPTKFSSIWFPSQSRLIVTSLIVFSNAISGQFGATISPFIIKQDLDQESGRNDLINYTIIQGVIISCIMILNLIFFRGSPQYEGYCFQKSILKKIQTTSYIKTLKNLIKSKDFIILVFTKMFTSSFLYSFATFIEIYITPFQLTSKDAGITTAISVLAGLVGSIISGILIRGRKNRYKRIIIFQYIIIIVSILVFYISLQFKIVPLYWTSIVLIGATIYSILPGLIQFTCQRMHPIGYATVTGFLIASVQLFSFFLGIIQAFILKQKTKQATLYSCLINLILLIIGLLLFGSLKNKNQKVNTSLLTQQI